MPGIQRILALRPADILATGHVTRWHMVRTTRHQTLAEHLALVTMFALQMVRAGKLGINPIEVVDYAMTHDVHEVEYGDIPTPSKRALKLTEHDFDKPFWSKRGLPSLFLPTGVEDVVSLADSLEAFLFYAQEGVDDAIRTGCWQSVERKLRTLFPDNKDLEAWVVEFARQVATQRWTPQP